MTDYQLTAALRRQRALREASGYTPPQKAKRQRYSRLTACPVPEPDLWPIAQAIMGAVGACVPDGDPIDRLAPKLTQLGVDRCDVSLYLDNAAKKHLGVTYTQYLIDAWDGWNEVCEPDQRMDNPWR